MALKKIFKKFGILDFIILLVIALSILIFSKFIHHKSTWINVDAVAYGSVFQANSLHAGDSETEPSGKKIAEINSVDIQDSPLSGQNTVFSKIVVLHLKILADSVNGGGIQYKNQPIRIGSQIDFTFSSTFVQAYISGIDGSNNYNYVYKTVTLVLYNRWPWLADAVNVGDTKKDQRGYTLVKIIGKNASPAEVSNTDSSGQSVIGYDNAKIDLTLKLNIRAQKINNELIFQGYNNLSVGNQITININNASLLNGYITKIE
ncbi:MAG TPA: hypothetical protein VG917_01285 [Patescibacteria group bacterium]|nr:hypothetical protein [Patescibacteria group bacterium]